MADTAIKFPEVEVQLTGEDGNAMGIVARVRRALRDGGATAAEIKEFSDDALSGDYDHVLATAMQWVSVS